MTTKTKRGRTPRNPFREAKQFLWNGNGPRGARQEEFICWALEEIRWVTGTAQAKRMVENRLTGYSTVVSYLWDRPEVKNKDISCKTVQFFRHRWLDHLADEWDRGVHK